MISNKFQIISKRRVVKLSATFFIGALLLSSCKKEESEIGSSLPGEGLDVQKVDTFSVITYSEKIDSMESDETAVNMLGQYNDPVFGNVDCGIVTQVRLSSANPSFAPNIADVIVDSVVLGLKFTTINYYANLDDITIEVFRIGDDLIRDDKDYYTFENPTIVGGDLVLPGTETQLPDFVSSQVVGTDTLSAQLRVRLDPTTIGSDLVAINGAGNMATDEAFVSAFKGLYIKVDGSSLAPAQGGVYYFSLENSLSKLTLFFHETADPASKFFDFNINSSCARYNKISYDRTGTRVESLLADKSLGQEEFYTQGGEIWSVVEIPYIMDLNLSASGGEDPKIINKAELIVPVQDFGQDRFEPSSSLFLAKVVDQTTSDFTLDYSFQSTLEGNTVNYDQDNKEFRFLMTNEIQAILNGTRENSGFRIYAPSFFASTIERVVFNGPESTLKNKTRLEITYTDY